MCDRKEPQITLPEDPTPIDHLLKHGFPQHPQLVSRCTNMEACEGHFRYKLNTLVFLLVVACLFSP